MKSCARATVRILQSFAGASLVAVSLSLSHGCSRCFVDSAPSVHGETTMPAGAPVAAEAAGGRATGSAPTLGRPAVSAGKRDPRSEWQAPRRPVLRSELVRLRRAAFASVLPSHRPPDARALFYEAPPAESDQAPKLASYPDMAACGATSSAPEAKATTCSAFGHFVPIENESALEHFHRALARLAAGEDTDGKVRILAYGASHTQADVYPGYLRAYLQSRFGDGGRGFVLPGRVNHWYRTLDMTMRHRRMVVHHARYRLDVVDEPLGLFGVALVGRTPDGFGEVTTSRESPNTRFEVQYLMQPEGGDFVVQVDGRKVTHVTTRSDARAMGYQPFEAAPGRHTIRLLPVGNGPVRLFGVVAETARSGVVIDTLGIGGSQLEGHLHWDERVWAEAVRHRDPDLVMFAYGTNEIMDPGYSLARYERQSSAVLARLRRTLPEASCLLISPFDLPQLQAGRWITRPRLLEVIGAQRRIAEQHGCGFWDGYAFTGGEGSLRRWAASRPPLASTDYVHLTPLGYAYAGAALGDALMRAFDRARVYSPGPEVTAAGAPG